MKCATSLCALQYTATLDEVRVIILEQLETDGLAILSNVIQREQLANMQRAFEFRLNRLRWNDFHAYKSHYIPAFERQPNHTVHRRAYDAKTVADEFNSRVSARLHALVGKATSEAML